MRKYSFQAWLNRLVWLAGLVLLISLREELNRRVLWQLASSRSTWTLWLSFLIPFLTGVYFSLLFLEGKAKGTDRVLFGIITLPTLFFSLLPALLASFELEKLSSDQLIWLAEKLNAGQILPLVAGLAFLPSLFAKEKRRR